MGGVAYGKGRQALLEAAVTIVAQQGLRGLTYRTVATEAGVTYGLVKHHFGNWDTLLEEALEYSLQRSLAGTELESTTPGFDDFAKNLVDFVNGDEEIQAFQFELALEARRRPELAPVLERVYSEYRAAVSRELLRNGIDDPDLTWAIFAALDGMVLQQMVFGAEAATRRAIASLRALLRDYAGSRRGVAGVTKAAPQQLRD
ncbi:TetR/AcrR family transcriptional regulator [Herbiconiux daphne]|uniref:TetR family transcriptional regulator n=1 Tax=Herbiconiux daphne TaxID=2970914 RepID=A0ABT2H6W8_9MICO|nr:TetR/AcrR family transcriptional regulator [Herbiconiux daphne]MCS5735688.1 TetR family transcriptional regulator [Herbiconiux daphne]